MEPLSIFAPPKQEKNATQGNTKFTRLANEKARQKGPRKETKALNYQVSRNNRKMW